MEGNSCPQCADAGALVLGPEDQGISNIIRPRQRLNLTYFILVGLSPNLRYTGRPMTWLASYLTYVILVGLVLCEKSFECDNSCVGIHVEELLSNVVTVDGILDLVLK